MCAVQSVSYVNSLVQWLHETEEKSIPYLEGRVLAEVSVREDQKELCTLRGLIGRLKGVRYTGWEVPQITWALWDHQ